MLKPNISPKAHESGFPTIRLLNGNVVNFFAYESETFHHRRPNGISHCENGEQKPPNVLFRLDYVDPHLIQQCLGPPQAPPQTAAPTVEALTHTDAVKSPLVTMARPKFAPQKVPLPVD